MPIQQRNNSNIDTLRKELLSTMNQAGLVKLRMEQGKMTVADLCALIASDHNILDYTVVRSLYSEGVLTKEQLLECGIEEGFIGLLSMKVPKDPQESEAHTTIDTIPRGYTEVYFWGMKNSGKTCALGSVLSCAKSELKTMKHHVCQGGDYMSHLASMFKHHGCYTFLPRATNISYSYEMRFSLTLDNQEHPLALIDMSGELFACLYKVRNNLPLQTDERTALDTLERLLAKKTSKNRKIHFFVVEYGAQDSVDLALGLPANEFLGRAAEYLNDKGVFSELTDAIYIVLTKTDQAPYGNDLRRQDDYFKTYMSTYYHDFYWNLREMCKNHSINGGNLMFVPFSIGSVCMRRLCHFNNIAAMEILDHILERSYFHDNSVLGRVGSILSK